MRSRRVATRLESPEMPVLVLPHDEIALTIHAQQIDIVITIEVERTQLARRRAAENNRLGLIEDETDGVVVARVDRRHAIGYTVLVEVGFDGANRITG